MTPRGRLGIVEFVALMAMLYATVAFSLDAMLPALPEIAAALTPADPNRAGRPLPPVLRRAQADGGS